MEKFLQLPEKEKYKVISGYPNYYISTYGNVYSRITKRILKYFVTNSGYRIVSLRSNGVTRKYSIHKLVCTAFKIQYKDKIWVNHIDGNKENNFIWNLEWVTPSENNKHSYNIGKNISICGEESHSSKLMESDVIFIRESNKTTKELANIFGVSTTAILDVKSKRTWKHI